MQRLWFSCKPLGYRQGRLEMRLNQPQDRMPPLRVPILTKMVVSASVASVLMRCCSGRHRSSSVLLLCIIRIHCVHHVRGGADDVSGLLIAALTASTHTPIGRGSKDAPMPTGVGLTSMQLPPVAT